MDDKQRCQSCGMPLGDGFEGTEADGSISQTYCTFCYQNGEFTRPMMTLVEMIKLSIDNMIQEVGYSKEKATEVAKRVIPQLGRWQNH